MQIADLAETTTSLPMPPHDATDADKLTALVESMEGHGWIGAPLLVDGEQALTGSHRIAAAARTNVVEIPRVEVRDLCAAHDLDWDTLLIEQGDWYWAGIELADLLPADVVAELGLDLH